MLWLSMRLPVISFDFLPQLEELGLIREDPIARLNSKKQANTANAIEVDAFIMVQFADTRLHEYMKLLSIESEFPPADPLNLPSYR